MVAAGVLKGGAVLDLTDTATTMRVRNGKRMVSDGPFAETSEQVAGIAIIEVANLDEALGARLNDIDWKVVFSLSLFGLAMGVATVFFIPSKIEPLFWLTIFVACAVIIALRCKGSYFLNGLFVSLVNSVWITAAHVVLFDAYAVSHAQEVSMAAQMGSPRLMMLMTGPVVGLLSGLILGLFAWIASKLMPGAASARV